MADISKIKVPNGTTYDIKDEVARSYLEPIDTRTYTNVIATANSQLGGGFFYLRVRPDNFYYSRWHVKVRVTATCPGTSTQQYYNTKTVFDVWGSQATVYGYICDNKILNTSYRPIYYNSVFLTNVTGYNNNCSHWIGTSLYYSTNPTSTTYYRTIFVELLEYDGCEVELQNSLIKPDNIPNRAEHTSWYSSTNISYSNYDACSNGIKQAGDANTTSIHALYRCYGNYIADSVLYRYQLLFHTGEYTLTPLNNVSNGYDNTAKAMLTNVAIDPFRPIYYYATTTAVAANGSIGAGSLFWHYGAVDLRYTFNMTTSSLTANRPLYLVVTPTDGGMCKLASSTPWAQNLPTSSDGYWYVLLGQAHNGYQIELYDDHPVYKHNGSRIVRVSPPTEAVSVLRREKGGLVANNYVYQYHLLFHMNDSELTPLNISSNSPASGSKSMLTNVEFDPFLPIYYYDSETSVSPDGIIDPNMLFWTHDNVHLGYTFNDAHQGNQCLSINKPLYLTVTPTANGKCKLASSRPLTQSLPTTKDGKWYIYLGQTFNGYEISLTKDHPVYMHDGTNVVRVTASTASSISNEQIMALFI